MNSHRHSTLDRLLSLIDDSPGFSGLGASIKTISSMSDADDDGIKQVTAAILRDAALTARLLRMANSSRNALSGRNVATIDQAITILGLNTVRSAAMSLTLLDCMSNKPQSSQLHAEIVAAYFCGSLAAEITRCNAPRSGPQESQVCGLLQNLGRLMAIYHLYDEIQSSYELQVQKNLTEDEAITHVLKTSFEEMGAAIARHWNLPVSIEESIAAKMDSKRPAVPKHLEWNQVSALFARRVTDALFRQPELQEKVEIENNIRIFKAALRLEEEEVFAWIDKLLAETDTLLADASFPCSVDQARVQLRKASERVMDRLSSEDSMTKKDVYNPVNKKPIEVFQQALRVIHDAFGFDRTFLCLPDAGRDLVAIVGVGRNALQTAAKFRCRGSKPDIFRLVMDGKLDMYIADTSDPSIAEYLPDWYHAQIGAPAFMLLSLAHDGKELGLLYGDFAMRPAQSPQPLATQEPVKEWREHLQNALIAHLNRPRR